METEKKHIKTLIEKAATAKHSHEALHFSQAASNAANALCALESVKSE